MISRQAKPALTWTDVTDVFYIDESMHQPNETYVAIAAVRIPRADELQAIATFDDFRLKLEKDHRIPLSAELHAAELLSNRGKVGGQRVGFYRGMKILREAMDVIASLPGIGIIGAATDRNTHIDWLFDRLLNRIDINCYYSKGCAGLICDHGKESLYPAICTTLRTSNLIPLGKSGYYQNKPLTNVADPIHFADSRSSHFLQVADLVAYALLRHNVPHPNPKKVGKGSEELYERLEPVLIKLANRSDPLGVIRV